MKMNGLSKLFPSALILVAAVLALLLVLARGATTATAAGAGSDLPVAAVDSPHAAGPVQTAVLSGGCFWGVQAVFEHVHGVKRVMAGYSGGQQGTAHYEMVSTGNTGHAESVQITFDPSQVSYGEILRVFFSVAHDPTQLNRQGPDHGTQYRSAIFFSDPGQERIARAYIAQLTQAHTFPAPIVTQVVPYNAFFPAEGYHQDYLVSHMSEPYIYYNDLPKLAQLRQSLPQLYRDQPALVAGRAMND